MKRFILILLTACLVLSFASAADKVVELKFGHYLVETHPGHLAAQAFADAVTARTNGAVKIVIFPNSKLGNSQEILEQVVLGAVDLAIPTEPAMAKYVNKFNMVGAPFAFKNYEATDAFFAGDFIKWVTPDVEKAGFKYIARWEYGFRNYTTSKRQLNKPEDMKGLKIRTPPDFVNSATVKALGGIAQTIAFSELPMALKQGVVDGQENPISTIYSNKMWETQKYLSILNYTYNSTHLVMNKTAFDKLTPDQQKIVLEEGAKAGEAMKKATRAEESSLVAELKKQGMEVAVPDTAPFIAAAASVYDELKSKVGEADYKTFMALLEKSR
ncbi:MAG: TRAP transporter substrate-binding protein [Spirochaetes bacterium]|nr:TRAP transporter substrate-binding protein [Spirochaetota bacterium]